MEQTKVCLMGHSFIRRLNDYMASSVSDRNLRLRRDLFSVQVKARGGLSVPQMARCRFYTEFIEVPDICYIQIGENDLDNKDITIQKLVEQIVSFVKYLVIGIGVRRVVVGQLFRRQPWAVSVIDFNSRVIEVNLKLEEELRDIEGALFWHHRGFWNSLDFLARDGVHIRCTGEDKRCMNRYLQSVKSSVLYAARH